MGTDIHLEIEWQDDNGKWHWLYETMPKEIDMKRMHTEVEGRNYNLFAVLANVRNGTWSEEFIPISEPKGLPQDISEELKQKAENDFFLGDHSFTYLTARELKEYNWEREIDMEATISFESFKEHINEKNWIPESYSAWSSGVTLTMEKAKEILSHPELMQTSERINVRYKWKSTYKEEIGYDIIYFLTNLVDFFKVDWREKDKYLDRIRIVFGFDS